MAGRIDRAARAIVALAVAAGLTTAFGLASGSAAAGRAAPVQLAQATTNPPAAAPAQQFAQLRQRLGIKPAQEGRFERFVTVLRENDAARAAFLQRNPPGRRRNALEELRVQSQAADLDARGLRQLLPAFEALYASLSAQQKQAADRVFAAPAR
jgi:periplasmic protein CpxP/Spy